MSDHQFTSLLDSFSFAVFFITPFVIFLGWVNALVSGHTKRECFLPFSTRSSFLLTLVYSGTTTNAIVLSGYAIGNIAGPFIWKKMYQPR